MFIEGKFYSIFSLLFGWSIALQVKRGKGKGTDTIPTIKRRLVCISAMLVPLHHKIEHWATAKLVEKNNKIRLAAAKKTIEQLEKDNSGKSSR